MKDKDFIGVLVAGAVLGCLLSLVLIFLGYVISDSIRQGVVVECVQNREVTVMGRRWSCSFAKEAK